MKIEKTFYRNLQWLFWLIFYDIVVTLILALMFFTGDTLEKIIAGSSFFALILIANIFLTMPYKVRLCKIYFNNDGIIAKLFKTTISNILWADICDIKYNDISFGRSIATMIVVHSINGNNISFKINNVRLQYLQLLVLDDNLKQKLTEIHNHINRNVWL